MKSILLKQNSNTFAVKDHSWQFTGSRLEFISQKIRHTISIFQGEWFMDQSIGIPYIPGENTEKNMHRRMIETAIQVRIGEIDGVVRFLSFSSRLDKATRKLTIDFTVQIDTGERYSHSFEVGG